MQLDIEGLWDVLFIYYGLNQIYVVGVISRYMQSPQESHVNAMKHLFRYLRGTTTYDIKYGKTGEK